MFNATTGNMNSTAELENPGPLLSLFNYVTLFLSVTIIVCEIVAVFVLQKCKRMTRCSRVLSISFILSDAVGSFIFAVHQITILGFGIHNVVTHNSRVLAVGTLSTVSWASVASLSLERAVALKINIKYNINASKLKIYLLVSLIWVVNILTVTLVFLLGLHFHCNSTWTICDLWKASKAGRFVMMILLIFYEIVLVVSYVMIHSIALHHARNIAAAPTAASLGQNTKHSETLTRRQYAATTTIIKIALAFMLLHAPIVIHLFVFETQTTLRDNTIRRIFHAFSYMCIQCNSFVSVHLYVAKIDECKLYFYLILSRMFKRYEKQAEELRINVYDIVLSTNLGHSRKQ